MITVILVRPETAGNIGAVCRVMKNFGQKHLVLVEPKCDYQGKESQDRAKHAKALLRTAQLLTWEEVRKKHNTLIATTSRLGTDYNVPRVPITPKQLAEIVPASKQKIGVVFGPEGSGLSNKEVLDCDFTLTIPTSSDYAALNLSHSAAIVLYELFQKQQEVMQNYPLVTEPEKKQIMKLLEQILQQIHFPTEMKRETQRRVWKRLISKSFMTKREAAALMGFLRKVGREIIL